VQVHLALLARAKGQVRYSCYIIGCRSIKYTTADKVAADEAAVRNASGAVAADDVAWARSALPSPAWYGTALSPLGSCLSWPGAMVSSAAILSQSAWLEQ